MTVLSTVRNRRVATGLSQTELAARVGVSRQALSAIEAGRQVPSTGLALQLARALCCTVDDLFQLDHGPTVQAQLAGLPTPEQSRVAVGRVDGTWVAHPISDDRAADGVIVGPAATGGLVTIQLLADPAALEATVLVAGCAPLLGVLAGQLPRRYRDARAVWIPANSTRSLDLLARRLVHVAGLHLADRSDPDAHVTAAQRSLPGQRATLVHLAQWRQGLVVAPGNPLAIASGADLQRTEVRCVAREAGAGAQRLLERVRPHAAPSPEHQATSHDEVAKMIRWGVADVGVAIEAVATAEGLGFVPLAEERFDLVVPASGLDVGPVVRLLDVIDEPAFRTDVAGLPGYDLSHAGHAATIGATP